MKGKIEGLGVAIATPFDEALNVDYEAFERLLDFLVGRDFETSAGNYAQRVSMVHSNALPSQPIELGSVTFRQFWNMNRAVHNSLWCSARLEKGRP